MRSLRRKVEDFVAGTIFRLIDYPASICPLTKRKKDNPEIASVSRFHLWDGNWPMRTRN